MRIFAIVAILAAPAFAQQEVPAETWLPSVFGSHMVLQRDQEVPIWGWDKPNQEVTVELVTEAVSDRKPIVVSATADATGAWRVKLPATPTGTAYKVTVTGSKTVEMTDVLFGEVWICSGQSNMKWPVNAANDADLERMAAKFPNLRLITVPNVGTQEPQRNFKGQWARCSPETVGQFSAVGYFFGRQLHQTLDVPVGLINNAWGGSACEAWIQRDLLVKDGRFDALLKQWKGKEDNLNSAMAAWEKRMVAHREKAKAARQAGKRPPRAPRSPQGEMNGNQRPSNIYNGVLKPTIGYGIRGAIWYQGESNAGRAYQYRDLFPYMIQTWREEWGQGDFPFYWVQLADYRAEKMEPADSDWAELREAQTMTMSKLPNTGEAVIIDIGEGRDIHPRNKQDVAKRLARWALAKDYGMDIECQSPTYKGMAMADRKGANRITLTFDHVGKAGLYTFDVREPIGFTIAGADKKFYTAKARLVPNSRNQVVVWSDEVSDPVAVRYAWADNPIANLRGRNGLPATPFRTDDWDGITKGKQTR
jgi:sialate O-acetylesterase